MAGIDFGKIINSQWATISSPKERASASLKSDSIQFLRHDSSAKNRTVGFSGDPFLANPAFRQSFLSFLKGSLSGLEFANFERLLDRPVGQFSDQDRQTLGMSLQTIKGHYSQLLQRFGAQDLQSIDRFIDEVSCLSRDTDASVSRMRKQLEAGHQMTDIEIGFRARAYLLEPNHEAVKCWVDQLVADRQLDLDADIYTLSRSITRLVNRKVRYKEEGLHSDGTVRDHWQRVDETLNLGTGDCEDSALLVGSVLMHVLARQGLSESKIREQVQLSAGYMKGNDDRNGHMVVRVRNGSEDLALDATQESHSVRPFEALNMDVVFEFNDQFFERYRVIDEAFATALQVTDRTDPTAITGMIAAQVSELNEYLTQSISIPSVRDGKVYHNGSEITGSQDFEFFSVHKQSTSGLKYDYWKFKLDQEAFSSYINETRDKINRITMLLHLGNAVLEARNKASRDIYDSHLSDGERNKISQSRDSTDQHANKFYSAFNSFQQRQGKAVQELANELFSFVQKNNDAQFVDLKYRVEMYMRENPLVGIGTAVLDEMVHYFAFQRSGEMAEIAKEEALIQKHNLAVYGDIARDMGERVELWSSSQTIESDNSNSIFYYDSETVNVLDSSAVTDALRKQTTLSFITNMNDQLEDVDRGVRSVDRLADKRNYFLLNNTSLGTDETTGTQRLLDANNMFNRSGPLKQFLDINMDQILHFRDYLARYQNFIRTVYMVKMSLWDMRRQVSAAIGEKDQSGAVSNATSSVQSALDTELSKQFTFIDQYTQQLSNYTGKVNELIDRSGQYYKDEQTHKANKRS